MLMLLHVLSDALHQSAIKPFSLPMCTAVLHLREVQRRHLEGVYLVEELRGKLKTIISYEAAHRSVEIDIVS